VALHLIPPSIANGFSPPPPPQQQQQQQQQQPGIK